MVVFGIWPSELDAVSGISVRFIVNFDVSVEAVYWLDKPFPGALRRFGQVIGDDLEVMLIDRWSLAIRILQRKISFLAFCQEICQFYRMGAIGLYLYGVKNLIVHYGLNTQLGRPSAFVTRTELESRVGILLADLSKRDVVVDLDT